MGKQSRRRVRTNTPRAPRTLSAETHPYFESEFKPIALSRDLLALDVVKSFKALVDSGDLVKWHLGRKGTHISSYFESADGTYDYLTSPYPDDQDYESLCKVHIGRAISVCQGEDILENDRVPADELGEWPMIKAILAIWRRQGMFIRFRDGNPTNCAISNLVKVSGVDAMKHMEWKVDWDMDLDAEQIACVRTNAPLLAKMLK